MRLKMKIQMIRMGKSIHKYGICVLQVTVVDFPLYEILDHLRTLKLDILVNFPKLNDFMCRMEALPAIKKYMGSDNFIKSPFHNP